MRKIIRCILSFFSIFLFIGLMTSCMEGLIPGFGGDEPTVEVDERKEIYNLAVSSGYTGTYEQWLESIKGEAVELSVEGDYLVWKYKSETVWKKLCSLSNLKGTNGTDGKDGVNGTDGKTPEFRVYQEYLQWKYTSETEWKNLYKISSNTTSNPVVEEKITITYVTEWDDSNNYLTPIKWVEREVNKGALVEPDDLVPEGYVCDGWYYVDIYTDSYYLEYTQWKFDAYYASKDMTLYGLFSKKYSVTYLDENGNIIKESCSSDNRGFMPEIYQPKEKDDYFVCWVNEENEEENYFAGERSCPQKDIVLKPLVMKTFTVTYLDEDGDVYKVYRVNPRDPYIPNFGYTPKDKELNHIGWSLDGENIFDHNTTLTSNITLYPICIDSKNITLTLSVDSSNYEFYSSILKDFTDYMLGVDGNTYKVELILHSSDMVDAEILDWSNESAPDVYSFAGEKITQLMSKGALAELPKGQYIKIKNNLLDVSNQISSINGKYYAYNYTIHNTYYLHYDSSVFNEEEVKDIMNLLDAANQRGTVVNYPLGTSYWSAGALFTFGANYYNEYNENYNVVGVDADFDDVQGQKAARAIYSIINHPAWRDGYGYGDSENCYAIIAGTWETVNIRRAFGENYACAPMPSVTIDGETKNLGTFIDGRSFGVNPQKSQGDPVRLQGAHYLAEYLTSEVIQNRLYEYTYKQATEMGAGTILYPTNREVADKISNNDINAKTLYLQSGFAHVQRDVPVGLWDAPYDFIYAIKNAECTLENIELYLKRLNDAVKAN